MHPVRETHPVLVLIERRGKPRRYLFEFNESWRAVMFPVTGPRTFEDKQWGSRKEETVEEAAGRAACEATGLLCRRKDLESLGTLHVTDVSLSGGQVTSYDFSLFKLVLEEDAALPAYKPFFWLTPDEILDDGEDELMPISPMARRVAQTLLEREFENG
jgi:hypothetical protein